jgi:hypothetical protein
MGTCNIKQNLMKFVIVLQAQLEPAVFISIVCYCVPTTTAQKQDDLAGGHQDIVQQSKGLNQERKWIVSLLSASGGASPPRLLLYRTHSAGAGGHAPRRQLVRARPRPFPLQS